MVLYSQAHMLVSIERLQQRAHICDHLGCQCTWDDTAELQVIQGAGTHSTVIKQAHRRT